MTSDPESQSSNPADRADHYRRLWENERRAGVERLEKYLEETASLRAQISRLQVDLRKVRDENQDLKQKLSAVYRFVPKRLLRSAWARFGPNRSQ